MVYGGTAKTDLEMIEKAQRRIQGQFFIKSDVILYRIYMKDTIS